MMKALVLFTGRDAAPTTDRTTDRATHCWMLGAGLLAFVGSVPACAPPEVLVLEHEVYEVNSGEETLVDSGCTELPTGPGEGFGFGFGTAPGASPVTYFVSYEFDNDSVFVSAGSTEAGAGVSRDYDADFLKSGEEDTLGVALSDAFALRLTQRGVTACNVSSDTGF
jgi:hypothetical protein